MAAILPAHVTLKDISATFNQDTVPRALLVAQPLPPELWAQVVSVEGDVELKIGAETQHAMPGAPVVIPPNTAFAFVPTAKPVRFSLHYFHPAVLADGQALAGMLGHKVA